MNVAPAGVGSTVQRVRGRIWLLCPSLCWVALSASMVDVVHVEGDHTSFLVLAPHPTLAFVHGGGEEGAFRRAHPGVPDPWWLRGEYLTLIELTDG